MFLFIMFFSAFIFGFAVFLYRLKQFEFLPLLAFISLVVFMIDIPVWGLVMGKKIVKIVTVVIPSLVVLTIIVLQFVMCPHKVYGNSMLPNYYPSELIWVSRLSYLIFSPKRGDVIDFHPPFAVKNLYISRIIGLPGDKISFDSGNVYINGKLLNENYLYPGSRTLTDFAVFIINYDEYTVPEDSYFVMGDNRESASDSRLFGPVSKKLIEGKVVSKSSSLNTD